MYCNYVRTQARGLPNRIVGWCEIPQWVVRNLITFKNCSIKESLFKKARRQFNYVFGEKNMTVKPSDFKDSITLEVNQEAVEQAKELCLMKEENHE